MKPYEKQLAHDVLLQSIITDFHYPRTAPQGGLYWDRSWALSELLFNQLHIEGMLCDALKRSEGNVFVLDKTLESTVLQKTYRAGELFYAWVSQGIPLLPPNYELPEQSTLLSATARRLGFGMCLFSKADPLIILNNDGLRQGELINSFGRRVYEQMTKAGTKNSESVRKRSISTALKKTERYFDRLSHNHGEAVGCLRLELHHSPELRLEASTRQLNAFITTLQPHYGPEELFGYWWKRRYMPECGYGYHFILCFNPRKVDWERLFTAISQKWNQATEGHGLSVYWSHSPENHRSWGSLSFSRLSHAHPLEPVMDSLRMMLMSERYLRLTPHHKYDHYGMGDLPTALTLDECWCANSKLVAA
ncbi:hypothetical protein [Azospira oryzae]|uniref:hypothetical protein n=1 Tax=Azospira oryzae TaxID=146939 RepID=UPI00196280AF|nr:hypothetical protein [Azospira oryzae]